MLTKKQFNFEAIQKRKTIKNYERKNTKMYKFWKISTSKSNKLILIKDQCIYKGFPKQEVLNKLSTQNSDFTFLEDLFSIPYSYIKSIENQSTKNHIKIYFGKDSEEELHIEDKNIKNDVFHYLKEDNPNLIYSLKTPSVIQYAKAQLFALLFTTALFLWSLYLAIQMESGVEYEIVGGGSRGIVGIVLIIAQFGVVKIVLGFTILLGIILTALTYRLKSRSETEYLKRGRY